MSIFEYSIPITADRKMSIITHLNNYAASLQVQIEDARGYCGVFSAVNKYHITRLEALLAEVTDDAQYLLEQ